MKHTIKMTSTPASGKGGASTITLDRADAGQPEIDAANAALKQLAPVHKKHAAANQAKSGEESHTVVLSSSTDPTAGSTHTNVSAEGIAKMVEASLPAIAGHARKHLVSPT